MRSRFVDVAERNRRSGRSVPQLAAMTWREIIISSGFIGLLKLAVDAIRFVWQRFRNRVTLDYYMNFAESADDPHVLEKFAFFVVRNKTDKEVTVSALVMENGWWYRIFPREWRAELDRGYFKVPARRGIQLKLYWRPGNLFGIQSKFFGVHLKGGRTVWLASSKLRKLREEFTADFPNWRDQPLKIEVLRYRVRASPNALPDRKPKGSGEEA